MLCSCRSFVTMFFMVLGFIEFAVFPGLSVFGFHDLGVSRVCRVSGLV